MLENPKPQNTHGPQVLLYLFFTVTNKFNQIVSASPALWTALVVFVRTRKHGRRRTTSERLLADDIFRISLFFSPVARVR